MDISPSLDLAIDKEEEEEEEEKEEEEEAVTKSHEGEVEGNRILRRWRQGRLQGATTNDFSWSPQREPPGGS